MKPGRFWFSVPRPYVTHEPSEAWPNARIAGLHQKLGGRMVELVGTHRVDDAQIVDTLFQVRQPVGNPGAAFSGLVEGIHASPSAWGRR